MHSAEDEFIPVLVYEPGHGLRVIPTHIEDAVKRPIYDVACLNFACGPFYRLCAEDTTQWVDGNGWWIFTIAVRRLLKHKKRFNIVKYSDPCFKNIAFIDEEDLERIIAGFSKTYRKKLRG